MTTTRAERMAEKFDALWSSFYDASGHEVFCGPGMVQMIYEGRERARNACDSKALVHFDKIIRAHELGLERLSTHATQKDQGD